MCNMFSSSQTGQIEKNQKIWHTGIGNQWRSENDRMRQILPVPRGWVNAIDLVALKVSSSNSLHEHATQLNHRPGIPATVFLQSLCDVGPFHEISF